MSESEYESPVKKEHGNIKEVMKPDRLKGDPFVTTEGRLMEKKIKRLLHLNVSGKRLYWHVYF